MPLFGSLLGTDQIINQLTRVEARLKQFEEKVMADFTNLDTAIADLGKEVGEIIDLLNTDAADQAKVDAAVVKLTAMKDALDAFTPAPPVEP